jgi:hypothetical protein
MSDAKLRALCQSYIRITGHHVLCVGTDAFIPQKSNVHDKRNGQISEMVTFLDL